MGLRPVDEPEEYTPPPAKGFTPANDDRQKDFRAAVNGLNRRSSTAPYWTAALFTVAWVGGGLLLAQMLFGPEIWQIRTGQQLSRGHIWSCSPSGHCFR